VELPCRINLILNISMVEFYNFLGAFVTRNQKVQPITAVSSTNVEKILYIRKCELFFRVDHMFL
jgi:hypothetical protein